MTTLFAIAIAVLLGLAGLELGLRRPSLRGYRREPGRFAHASGVCRAARLRTARDATMNPFAESEGSDARRSVAVRGRD